MCDWRGKGESDTEPCSKITSDQVVLELSGRRDSDVTISVEVSPVELFIEHEKLFTFHQHTSSSPTST